MGDIIGSIIAMKGHPFTRKTELAKNIASSLGCPMLSYEHFLDELHPPLSQEREKEVFLIIRRMAYHQIRDGISEAVVIDSPLSSAWHLQRLTEMASSFLFSGVRVIIIECKPTNAYSWRLKFEEYMTPSKVESLPWYKPKKWEDVEKAIEINPDYDEKSVRGHELVSKLVVDPLFLRSFREHIVEAVKYMMTRHKGDGSDVVLFHQWKQLQSSSSSTTTGLDCKKHGHKFIVSKSTVEEGLAVDCAFCEKQVMMSDDDAYYYYCKGCSLALHKDCAESSAPKRMDFMNSFDRNSRLFRKYTSRSCKGKGEGFSRNCGTCAVETQLSNRQRPTVISHVDTEEHFLTEASPKNFFAVNYCVVCRKDYSGWSMYLCNICGLAYHYVCVTMPLRVEHEHGLHHHHLSLKYTSDEAEDYLCHECQEYRDPTLWFYSCEDCPYELHPSCVNRKTRVYRSDSSDTDSD